MKLSVQINNVNLEQARDLIFLFDVMSQAGEQGSSRHVNLFVDGDGSFRPKIQYSLSESNDVIFRSRSQHYKFEVFDLLKSGKDIGIDIGSGVRRNEGEI